MKWTFYKAREWRVLGIQQTFALADHRYVAAFSPGVLSCPDAESWTEPGWPFAGSNEGGREGRVKGCVRE